MKVKTTQPFSKDILIINDIRGEYSRLVANLRESILHRLNRQGGVIGISGGIDSSVTMVMAAKALGTENLLAVIMPEKDSSGDSILYAQKLADKFGVNAVIENITGALEGFGCYERRDEAVKKVFPEYNPSLHKMKIGIRNTGLYTSLPPLFSLTIVDSKGNEQTKRVPATALRQIEAASNFKQRCRMSMLYYHAERLHYAVIGTPNKHEVDQGFFVKNGDGGADVTPIANLYKTQIYQLAQSIGIPQEIIDRVPTSDTYSAEQTQEEFFFQMPFHLLDLLWYAFKNEYDPEEVGTVMEINPGDIRKIFEGFERKIKTTEYLRMQPINF
jgi:NAD+ synthase